MSVQLNRIQGLIANGTLQNTPGHTQGIGFVYPMGAEQVERLDIFNNSDVMICYFFNNQNQMIIAATGNTIVIEDWRRFRKIDINPAADQEPEPNLVNRFVNQLGVGLDEARGLASVDFHVVSFPHRIEHNMGQ